MMMFILREAYNKFKLNIKWSVIFLNIHINYLYTLMIDRFSQQNNNQFYIPPQTKVQQQPAFNTRVESNYSFAHQPNYQYSFNKLNSSQHDNRNETGMEKNDRKKITDMNQDLSKLKQQLNSIIGKT
jgi:hypothetical protein